MFARLGHAVVGHPWRVIAAWVVVAVGLVVFAPNLDSITNNDQTQFLPKSYESAQASEIASRAFPQADGVSAIIVLKRQDGGELTAGDQEQVGQVAAGLQSKGIDQVTAAVTSPQMVSPNRKIALISVQLDGTVSDPAVTDAVETVRDSLPALLSGGTLQAGVTGQAAIALDTMEKFNTAETVVGIVTIVLIVLLMLLMFRSPLAAIMPILTIALVMMVSNSMIALAGTAFDFEIGDFLPILLTVVLFGIGTDYILFLLFRYRERLRRGDESREAIQLAVHKVGEAIASAAGAVIVAFLALALSSFKMFETMGPSMAIAVGCMLIASLTLIPAVISLIGPKVFWPSKSWRTEPKVRLAGLAGRQVARRPLLIATVASLLLAIAAGGLTIMKQDYESLGSPQSGTEAATWFDTMQIGFPAGTTTPTQVYVTSTNGQKLDPAALTQFAGALATVKGVGQIQPAGVVDQQPVLYAPTADGLTAQITLLLASDPYSNEAMDAVEDVIRPEAHRLAPAGTEVKVGGTTSAFVDVRTATTRDLKVIFPVAAVLILLVLAFLLRAVLAPLYLMVAVLFGYAATLGATAFAFQGIGGEPGLMFMLPIITYLFVVAIGTDYNILMIARLREEAQLGLAPRQAADMAVEHTGPSIASAGVILAGTFCALLFSGITMLSQIGFAVAVGIVLASFVMAMFVVPSVTALIGPAAWWPGHGGDRVERPSPHPDAQPENAELLVGAGKS
ncbi:MAG: MMPL family transporter [Micromonosporaceae bacterium]|nr:MMPL family transporter [Micromonosporaceae bacterium]